MTSTHSSKIFHDLADEQLSKGDVRLGSTLDRARLSCMPSNVRFVLKAT
jgi:hypothetical protein